jgi:DNA-binding IclR family transcriptional regulator
MAFMPTRRRQQLIEQNRAELTAVGLGSTLEEIQLSLKKVRKAGFAVAYGEVTPGVIGIAAPVFDARRLPIASVCLTIAGSLVTGSQIDVIGAMVRRAAGALSASPERPISD